ncbi:hydrogenase maturation nickel metallochaperone HypA [Actinobacillus porcinus]|uniref:Hydrogenase maturation factor HypA n=1 Tax=Actinobacillus porcinus TaxID=51048 RepID=A0ABY6TIL5_9PAST|nr:hydrogenase maturation nickel metallochaperone HypA [Actinobacillus porcinus]VFY92751.1 hydrogenase nickel incorporation protein HybF [Actinobacillus porcinus]VTU07219.1 hydrogenase nickel incorporation protein HybF [Actinobacillus porcinus]
MHEMSLCQNMMKIIEKECEKQNVKQVTDLWLEIGALSCVEKSSLEFCFAVVCRETVAAGCKLHFIDVPAQAWCWQCSRMVELAVTQASCPYCGGTHFQMQQGNELRIKEMAVK